MRWGTNEMGNKWDGGPMRWGTNNVHPVLYSGKMFCCRQSLVTRATSFHQIGGFPGVCGAIDGTHVAIKAPSGPHEPDFVNRKQFHSINVQVIKLANSLTVHARGIQKERLYYVIYSARLYCDAGVISSGVASCTRRTSSHTWANIKGISKIKFESGYSVKYNRIITACQMGNLTCQPD